MREQALFFFAGMRLLLLLPLLLTLAHAQDIVDLYGDDAEIDWDEQEAIDRELKGKQFPVRHENGVSL